MVSAPSRMKTRRRAVGLKFAARVTARAVRCLGEHDGQGVFAHPAWSAEQHGVRHSVSCEHPLQRRDHSLVSRKLRKSHLSLFPLSPTSEPRMLPSSEDSGSYSEL